MVWCRLVEAFATGYVRHRPVGLVPSLSHDPLAWRKGLGCMCNARKKIIKTGKVIQQQVLAFEGPFVEMNVGVNKAWNNKAAIKINLLCCRSCKLENIFVCADGLDSAISNGDGLCLRHDGIL